MVDATTSGSTTCTSNSMVTENAFALGIEGLISIRESLSGTFIYAPYGGKVRYWEDKKE